jgi:hypothetical protein
VQAPRQVSRPPGFTGTFTAVLTFSALCLFSVSRFALVRGDR